MLENIEAIKADTENIVVDTTDPAVVVDVTDQAAVVIIEVAVVIIEVAVEDVKSVGKETVVAK